MGKYQKKPKTPKVPKIETNCKQLVTFLKRHCSRPTFLEEFWFANVNNIRVVDSEFQTDYLPEDQKSAKLHTKVFQYDSEGNISDEWTQLNVFESTKNQEASCVTAFIGSHSHAMEWLPEPWHWISDKSSCCKYDYLLLATQSQDDCFSDHEKANFYQTKDASVQSRAGLLQLWKYDSAKNSLQLVCCFAHDFGKVWAIEACKGGTSFSCKKNRLCLVAIAFNDGYVRIFSIPTPESLPLSNLNPPMFILPPVAVLEPPYKEYILCKCLAWSWCDEQAWLVAGYGNGFVSLFNLKTKSPLLLKIATEEAKVSHIRSFKTWFAHGAAVTSLQILPFPGSNLIVSGGFERFIKLWNVKDLRMPSISIQHRSIVHCLGVSLQLPIGFFTSLEDCFLAPNQTTVAFKQVITEGEKTFGDPKCTYSMPWSNANAYSINFSLFYNSLLVGDNAGNVILHNNFTCKHDRQRSRKLTDVLPIFITRLSEHSPAAEQSHSQASNVDTETNERDNCDDDGYLISNRKPRERSYKEITSKYGLVFNDFPLDFDETRVIRILTKFKDNPLFKRCRPTDYPLSAINKCTWSPNKKSSNSIANLVHSGFLRITCIPITVFTPLNDDADEDETETENEDEDGEGYDVGHETDEIEQLDPTEGTNQPTEPCPSSPETLETVSQPIRRSSRRRK